MNILFIICHDFSPRFACYGHEHIKSPHLDKLASQGTLFKNHFCHAPLCSPSRANLMTGCRPSTTKHYNFDNFFDPFFEKTGFLTLPAFLRKNNYYTVSLGEVFHGRDTDQRSWDEQEWPTASVEYPKWVKANDLCNVCYPSDDAFRYYRDTGSLELCRERFTKLIKEGVDPIANYKKWRGPAIEGTATQEPSYGDEILTTRTIEKLMELKNKSQPFFLGTGYFTGHLPYCVPQKYLDLYPLDQIKLPELSLPTGAPPYATFANEPAQYYTTEHYTKEWYATQDQARELLQGHYASITYFDDQVGLLLKTLEKNGMSENTAVVLTTDHGYSLGEHRHWGKVTLYEPDLHVPLFIKYPGQKHHGIKQDAITEHIDIYPTIVDLCKLPKPSYLEGESLFSLLENPTSSSKNMALGQFGRPYAKHEKLGISLRTPQFRLTCWQDIKTNETIFIELYDKKKDPNEMLNVSEDPNYKNELKKLLEKFKSEIKKFK